jgi:hypothetical protein
MPRYKVKYWEREEVGLEDTTVDCDEIKGTEGLIRFVKMEDNEKEKVVFAILRERFVSAKVKE